LVNVKHLKSTPVLNQDFETMTPMFKSDLFLINKKQKAQKHFMGKKRLEIISFKQHCLKKYGNKAKLSG